MAVSVTHATQSAAPDSADGKISSDAWNESHAVTGLGTAAEADAADFAAAVHTHAQADITGLVADLAAKEPTITATTSADYYRGDKTFQTLNKAAVGLESADNTADAAKNVLSATKLTTARNINGVAFDGSANITINAVDSTARVPETRTITTTAPLTGGGDLSANRTFAITAATSGAAGSMSAADKTKLDAISGTNTGDQTITLTGPVTGSGTGSFATTITAKAVTLSKMDDVATATVFYRKTAGTGAPEVQTLATLKTDLGLTGTNSGDQTITLTGDVTGSGTGSFAATIGANKVTFSKFVAAGAASMVGATAAGDFAELTPTQSRTVMGLGTSAIIDTGTSGTKVPLLDAANTWTLTQALASAASLQMNVGTSDARSGVNFFGSANNNYGIYQADGGQLGVGPTGALNPVDGTIVTARALRFVGPSAGGGGFIFETVAAAAAVPTVVAEILGSNGNMRLAGTLTATNVSGTNTGDQTSIVGITGTIAQFNTAVTDADIAIAARTISTTAPLQGGGDLTASRTLTIDAATTSLPGSMSAQDKTRLDAHAAFYRCLIDSSGHITAAAAAGTYGMPQGQALAISGTGTAYALNALYIAAADYPAIGTLTAKLRIRVMLYCNDVAPGVTFTIGLHPITRPATSGGLGLCIYTIGAAVASSTVAIATPAADSSNVAVTAADIALPADGHYVIGVVTSGGALAASSHVHISAVLQLRYS